MDIPAFGALLRFAIELEEEHRIAYQEAAEKTDSAKMKETFLALAQQNKKNQSEIERIYRGNIRSDMDIGVQEPIPGLNRSDYLDEGKLSPGTNSAVFATVALNWEKRAQRFYLDSVLQTKDRWPAASRSLDKLAREKLERIARLERDSGKDA
jgi:hypothetical protein